MVLRFFDKATALNWKGETCDEKGHLNQISTFLLDILLVFDPCGGLEARMHFLSDLFSFPKN